MLVAILGVAVIGRANTVAVAAGILLIIRLLHIESLTFPALEKVGLFWGLVLLIAVILIPIAKGNITDRDIWRTSTSWIAIIALVLSLLTTYLSGLGLKYLTIQGHGDIMPALILGAVIAASFWGGVPVGPLITSGLLAIVMKMFHKM